jgi:hypothetical protein
MTEDQSLSLVDVELAARRDQVARFRDRDRSFTSSSGFPFDLPLATAVAERLHHWGKEGVDQHIEFLTRLRDDLRSGRLRSNSTAPEVVSPKQIS